MKNRVMMKEVDLVRILPKILAKAKKMLKLKQKFIQKQLRLVELKILIGNMKKNFGIVKLVNIKFKILIQNTLKQFISIPNGKQAKQEVI